MNLNLEEFIKNNECDYTKNIITEETLKKAEQELELIFGSQLKEYITKYGYLGFESIELYGMNSKQNLESDLCKQTKYLHENFDITKNYIAIQKTNDNIYALVDETDNVYQLNLIQNKIENLNIKLEDYILKIFNEEYENN